jgi:hypothetical protein
VTKKGQEHLLLMKSVAELSRQATIVLSPDSSAARTKPKFMYGKCVTDHKDGENLRHAAYTKDKPYAAFVQKVLKNLGLPLPKDGEVFHGTEHDLLFLDSHGVVIRIGPANIPDLMNPAIVQPLGWVTDQKNMIEIGYDKAPLTVAIYPGVELYQDFHKNDAKPDTNLDDFMEATGQGTTDLHAYNKGIIRVLDHRGKEVAVEMLLDADNYRNGSSNRVTNKRSKVMSIAEKEMDNFGEAVSKTVVNIFNAAKDAKWYQKAYMAHEPLRRLYWEAFKGKAAGAKPDAKCIKHFWDTCARVTNNPGSCVMPVWKAVKNGRKTEFVREEAYVPHVVLYRPWTGHILDKFIPPVGQDPEIAKALRAEFVAEYKCEKQQKAENLWKEHLEEELHHGEDNWQILADQLEREREEAVHIKQMVLGWNLTGDDIKKLHEVEARALKYAEKEEGKQIEKPRAGIKPRKKPTKIKRSPVSAGKGPS